MCTRPQPYVSTQVGPQLPGRRVEPAVLRAAKQREGRQEGVAAAPREEEPVTLREAAVPALLLAAAPLLTRAAAHLRAPKPLQWLIGLAAAANVPRATASGHCLWPALRSSAAPAHTRAGIRSLTYARPASRPGGTGLGTTPCRDSTPRA